jgi:hypothetical protein
MKLKITSSEEQTRQDRKYWRSKTPEERLGELEKLRIQAGKFLYEYPSRLRRVIKITRKTQR